MYHLRAVRHDLEDAIVISIFVLVLPDHGALSVANGNSVVVDELISFLPLVCSVYVITGLSLKLCNISNFLFVRFDSITTIQSNKFSVYIILY